MGISNVSCRCIKSCRDSQEEVDLAGGEYLRSKSGNLKINNNPIQLGIYKKSKTQSTIFRNKIPESGLGSKIDTDNPKEKIKDTVPPVIYEETEENKYLETNNNPIKTVNSFNNNINQEDEEEEKEINLDNQDLKEKEINKNDSEKDNDTKNQNSIIKFIPNFDKIYFYTKKLKNAEKNFPSPINFDKDLEKYIKEDEENNEMLILINSMIGNKGAHQTDEDGIVMEYKGEKYLYIGEMDKNGFPSGLGTLYTQGKKYEGNFSKGKLIGLGRYIDEEGTCYEGIFEGNKLISKATMIKLNENNKRVEYFGDLVDFKKNGKGEEMCEDEYNYTGDFKDDMWHGNGQIKNYETGDVYNGQFDKGEMTGKGILKWKNGEIYEGTFVKGIKHGKGIHKWPDGSFYKGEYINGIREGKGEYKWPDGRIFKGKFKNGKPDGKGKISYKGKTIECEFQNGKPISDLSILYSSF